MRKKLVFSLSLLFLLFSLGAGLTMVYNNIVVQDLRSVINLHKIEIIRQNLVISAQKVQGNLYTTGTVFGREVDVIVENVMHLDSSVKGCIDCHHTKEMTDRLLKMGTVVEQYKDAISYLLTTTANPERIERLKMVAVGIGESLLTQAQEMAFLADQKLNEKTIRAIEKISNSRIILIVTLILALVVALVIAISLTRDITNPVYELVNASRMIAAGNLGYKTAYAGQNEFGELAQSFNEMSHSLQESNAKVVENLNRLAGLYRVTLPLHAVTNLSDIFKVVSMSVAELIDVEICCVMLLNEEGDYYEPRLPAFGLPDDQAPAFRIDSASVKRLFGEYNRRPVLVNDMQELPLPRAFSGTETLVIRNMVIGWVRQKDEVIGLIYLANQKEGSFPEESARLVGIISNNISVAIENIKLYENLRAQMKELKETQEQLVQAAKLAAIGELASNVAHEINNPLTSIMGYAELIKEEDNIANIIHDVGIIEKESMRARDIVQQLLEFARKRPLEIRQVDVNGMIRDVVSLMNVQVKDARNKIKEQYADIPLINGDPNQLKQVFLNLISNAFDALPERGGQVSITTGRRNDHVLIDIADNGHGIPHEVIPRIFEPFFTTKREKGTGLGLSITYKIIQSHRGKIDVKSEEGKGTRFTVSLPLDIQ